MTECVPSAQGSGFHLQQNERSVMCKVVHPYPSLPAHHIHLSQHTISISSSTRLLSLCVSAPPPPALSASIHCHCRSSPDLRSEVISLTPCPHWLWALSWLPSRCSLLSVSASKPVAASDSHLACWLPLRKHWIDFSFLYPEGHWHPAWFSESLLNGTLARGFL